MGMNDKWSDSFTKGLNGDGQAGSFQQRMQQTFGSTYSPPVASVAPQQAPAQEAQSRPDVKGGNPWSNPVNSVGQNADRQEKGGMDVMGGMQQMQMLQKMGKEKPPAKPQPQMMQQNPMAPQQAQPQQPVVPQGVQQKDPTEVKAPKEQAPAPEEAGGGDLLGNLGGGDGASGSGDNAEAAEGEQAGAKLTQGMTEEEMAMAEEAELEALLSEVAVAAV